MAGVAAAQWAEMVERAAELRREAQQQRGAGA
jgi:hypothetical protein